MANTSKSPKGKTSSSGNKASAARSSAAGKRTSSVRRSPSGGSAKGSGRTGAPQNHAPLVRDLILLFLIALAVLMFLSLFGIVGVVGRFFARLEFGLFGRTAYLFPFVFIALVFFSISNWKKYPANTILRILTALFTFTIFCGIVELVGSGGEILPELKSYYRLGRGTRLHGGWFGGLWCRLFLGALGRVGSYVILLVLFLAGVVLTFGKALLTLIGVTGSRMAHAIKDETKRHRAVSQDRRKIARMKAEERLQKRTLEKQERNRREEAERKALMEELDRKLAEGRKRLEADQELELKEVRRKKVRTPQTEAEGVAGSGIREEKPRSIFDETDLSKPVLPADTSIQELFNEMESHQTGEARQEALGPRQDIRTIEELRELDEKRPALRINRPLNWGEEEAETDFTTPFRTEEGTTASPAGPKEEAEPLLGQEELSDAFDGFDRSRKQSGTEPRIQIAQKANKEVMELPIQEQEDSIDPRTQLRKLGESSMAGQKEREAKSAGPKWPAEAESLYPAPSSEFSGQADPAAALKAPPKREFRIPPTNLLKRAKNSGTVKESDLKQTALLLENTLRNFGVEVTVTDISCGPSVTRYELRPEQGVKVARISSLADDIKLALAATEIRIEAPIPGKSAVGIEVPNSENQTVSLRSIVESEEFNKIPSRLAFAVGQDIGGRVVVADLAKMPHLLIAGATGSGKSVCINSLIVSILYRAKPDEVQFIMIDPKVVELGDYNGIPHLRIPVVTDPKLAAEALNGAVKEMTARYKHFADLNVRDIKGYNAKIRENPEEYGDREILPQIVVIVDEFADLMMVAPGDVEQSVCRLAQLARAAGIHLVVATQRPSVNVITGLIKANIQSRIALTVSSGVDSRTIIDMNGAEKLLGKGDMLFYPTGYPKPVRVQGCWVSDEEIESVTNFWKKQNAVSAEEMARQNQAWMEAPADKDRGAKDERDELFMDAAEHIIENEKASIGNLQRVFRIGFNRAARLMDQLAEEGIVGKDDGTKARQIQMDRAQFEAWKQSRG